MSKGLGTAQKWLMDQLDDQWIPRCALADDYRGGGKLAQESIRRAAESLERRGLVEQRSPGRNYKRMLEENSAGEMLEFLPGLKTHAQRRNWVEVLYGCWKTELVWIRKKA